MKNVIKFSVFCAFLLISAINYAQKIEVPIQWKVGDNWTYDLKQRNLGGITGGDKWKRKSFQIKVLGAKAGYEVEWKYLSYSTFETDTLEDECATMLKQFLLQIPLKLKLNEKGEFTNWIGGDALKKQMLAFYTSQSSKSRSTHCLDNLKSFLSMADKFDDVIDALVPEIEHFFLAFSLLPSETNFKKDTVEVFTDYIFDFTKTIRLPKIITQKASNTFGNALEVSFLSQISEPEYKKYFDESTRASWDKLGLEKGDGMRKGLEEQLAVFQPKKSDAMEAVFDKTNGAIIKFDYLTEEWGMLKGGESIYYYFTRR